MYLTIRSNYWVPGENRTLEFGSTNQSFATKLRAPCYKYRSKKVSLTKFVVRGTGLAPAHHYWRHPLRVLRLLISPPAHYRTKTTPLCVRTISKLLLIF